MTGEEFRAWRKRAGLTQLEASQALGVALRTLKGWEHGEPPMHPRMLELACVALDWQRCAA